MTEIVTLPVIKEVLDKAIPDGSDRKPFDKIVDDCGRFREQVLSFAFGQPDSVSRKGDDFIARAKEPATMKKFVRVKSAAEVKFSIGFGDNTKWHVHKISGLTIWLPFPFSLIYPEFELKEFDVSLDSDNNFVLATKPWEDKKPVNLRIKQNGMPKLF